ncbi:hypothetical protein [Streptomyces virginiae]|uniref:hypothetical protein n=1 Tax=Streptomyces virginiae TaxID=1961 RepID=UPI0005275FB9|nr:hypothetical protein [Streptomyces virginiae]MCX4718289.1 hypothetical protein [Streptomyces virginiae]
MPDLQETAQVADALRQTSQVTGKLLATASLSDAATTLDGREAIALLRHLTEATSLAAIRTADTISDLAHGDTAPASASLDRAAAHLAGTPTAVHRVGDALQRHEGHLHAQDHAARNNLGAAEPTAKVSEAQRRALASLARGDAVLRDVYGRREVIAPPASYLSVRASSIDALATRGLVTLTTLPEQPGHHALHVTTAGLRALLAAASGPRRRQPLPARRPAPVARAVARAR